VTAFYMSSEYPIPMYAEGVVIEPISMEEYKAMAETEARKILDGERQGRPPARLRERYTIAAAPEATAAAKHKSDAIVMASHTGASGGAARQ
jgi:hypothetical protein